MVRKINILIIMFITLTAYAYGTTYYVTKSGNDSNTGRYWAAAWASVNKVNTSLVHGDTVRFGTGRWLNSMLTPATGGTSSSITVYACSTFSAVTQGRTIISSGDSVRNWTLYSGNIYQANWTPNQTIYWIGGNFCTLVQDDTLLRPTTSIGAITVGQYYYNGTTIYAWLRNNANPSTHEIIATCRPTVYIDQSNQSHLLFFGLTFKMGVEGTVVFCETGQDSAFFVHCNIAHSSFILHENPAVIMSRRLDPSWGYDNTFRSCSIYSAISIVGTGADWHMGSGAILYSQRRMVFDSCYFARFPGSGVYWKNDIPGSNIQAYGNTIRNSTFDGAIGGMSGYGAFLGVWPSRDSVYGNIFKNISVPAIRIDISSDGDHDPGNHFICNNTAYNCGGFLTAQEVPVMTDSTTNIKYNVFYDISNSNNWVGLYAGAGDNGSDHYFVLDSNYYYDPSTAFRAQVFGNSYTWSTWRTYGKDTHSFNTNPGLANPAAGDFSRPSAGVEMSQTYGGRTWTRFGAIQPAGRTYTVSGTITYGGNGLDSVIVSGLPGIPMTNGSGSYTATVDSGWSGIATPFRTSYTFTPVSRIYTPVNSNQSAQNYTATGDTTRPVISAVVDTFITDRSALITWLTNEAATSAVDFGANTSYGQTDSSLTLISNHSINLSGLLSSTTYHYRIRSSDSWHNQAVSADYTFQTLPSDTTPPTFSNIAINNITDRTASISWTTNEIATTRLEYGLTTSYGQLTALDSTLNLNHTVNLNNLIADTLYHFRARSRDIANNEGISGDFTFRTDTLVVIVNLALGITPTVSSTYSGYSVAAINDSVIAPRGGTATTWASTESATLPHWVQFDFGRRVSVIGMKIYWAWNGFRSAWMCSRQYRIQYWNDVSGAFADIDTVNNSNPDSSTATWFEPMTTTRIRYYQTPNMGSLAYPTVAWLTEMEIYGAEANDDLTPPSTPSNIHGGPYNGQGSIEFRWNAPGDDSTLGTAYAYLIKYMPDTGNAFDWDLATFFAGTVPIPDTAGAEQSCVIDSLEPGIRYFAAIRAYDDAGNASPEAVIDTFTSGITTPIQIRTVIDTSACATTVVASLVDSYMNIFYEFALDSISNFPNPRLEQELSADTVADFRYDSLSQRVTYYWKCRAKSNNGPDSSTWSPVISFNIMTTDINQALTASDCESPLAGEQVVSNRPTFTVRYISDLAIVYFEVDDSQDFSSPIQSGAVFADGSSPISWRLPDPVDKGGLYYWRASSDNMVWTAPIAFTVVLDIHAYPIPFRASEGLPGIIFTNLPDKSKIIIATVSGDVVRSADNVGPLEWVWDVKNNNGRELASGVYLYVVNYGGGSTQGKVIVIR